jgi:hypothetical protein
MPLAVTVGEAPTEKPRITQIYELSNGVDGGSQGQLLA